MRSAVSKRKAIFELRHIQEAVGGKVPFGLDALEDRVEELHDLDEFLAIIQDTIRSTLTVCLEDIVAFKPHPRESLLKMDDHFNTPST